MQVEIKSTLEECRRRNESKANIINRWEETRKQINKREEEIQNINNVRYKNPREASSRSKIFLFSPVNVSVGVSVGLWVGRDLLAKRKTIQT